MMTNHCHGGGFVVGGRGPGKGKVGGGVSAANGMAGLPGLGVPLRALLAAPVRPRLSPRRSGAQGHCGRAETLYSTACQHPAVRGSQGEGARVLSARLTIHTAENPRRESNPSYAGDSRLHFRKNQGKP